MNSLIVSRIERMGTPPDKKKLTVILFFLRHVTRVTQCVQNSHTTVAAVADVAREGEDNFQRQLYNSMGW